MGTTLSEVNGMRNRQAGGIFSSHQSDNQREKERKQDPGLHKNTSHAYSQDVLSFMLGREGKSVHTGNNNNNNKKKEIKQHKMGISPVETLLEKLKLHGVKSNTILAHFVGLFRN